MKTTSQILKIAPQLMKIAPQSFRHYLEITTFLINFYTPLEIIPDATGYWKSISLLVINQFVWTKCKLPPTKASILQVKTIERIDLQKFWEPCIQIIHNNGRNIWHRKPSSSWKLPTFAAQTVLKEDGTFEAVDPKKDVKAKGKLILLCVKTGHSWGRIQRTTAVANFETYQRIIPVWKAVTVSTAHQLKGQLNGLVHLFLLDWADEWRPLIMGLESNGQKVTRDLVRVPSQSAVGWQRK